MLSQRLAKAGKSPPFDRFIDGVLINTQKFCHFCWIQNLREILVFFEENVIIEHGTSSFLRADCGRMLRIGVKHI